MIEGPKGISYRFLRKMKHLSETLLNKYKEIQYRDPEDRCLFFFYTYCSNNSISSIIKPNKR